MFNAQYSIKKLMKNLLIEYRELSIGVLPSRGNFMLAVNIHGNEE